MSTVKELQEQAIEAIEALYSACQRDVEALETKVADLESDADADCAECSVKDKQIDSLKSQLGAYEWGNCRRGCPSAYLVDGFCSPACKLGAPRGEFVTVAA